MNRSMNRKHRRLLAKKGVFENIYENVRIRAHEQMANMVMTLFCATLRDEYGFGPKRFVRLLESVARQAEAMERGETTFEAIRNDLLAECPMLTDFLSDTPSEKATAS